MYMVPTPSLTGTVPLWRRTGHNSSSAAKAAKNTNRAGHRRRRIFFLLLADMLRHLLMRPILPHQTFLHKPPQMTFLSPLGAMDFLKIGKQKKHAAWGSMLEPVDKVVRFAITVRKGV